MKFSSSIQADHACLSGVIAGNAPPDTAAELLRNKTGLIAWSVLIAQ
jgi:hypothetical protein